MMVLENKDLAVARKVPLVLLLIAVYFCCCNGKPQETECIIQSFWRSEQGSGQSGIGNLLLVHVQSNAPYAPTRLSFTGSCNDSANYTEFMMLKKYVGGSLVVSFLWKHGRSYVVAIKNRTLVIEHVRKLKPEDEFVFKCISSLSSCTLESAISPSSPVYVSNDSNGNPSVGNNSTDVTTWFNIRCLLKQKLSTACSLGKSSKILSSSNVTAGN